MPEYKDHKTGETVSINAAILTDENEYPQRRVVKKRTPKEKSEKLVEVICICENRPWVELLETDDNGNVVQVNRPLAKKERVFVAEWIADTLVENEHAVRV